MFKRVIATISMNKNKKWRKSTKLRKGDNFENRKKYISTIQSLISILKPIYRLHETKSKILP